MRRYRWCFSQTGRAAFTRDHYCRVCSFSLFCLGLGSHVLVCTFKVLISVPSLFLGIVPSLIIIFTAGRIWSVGEQMVAELAPKNVISAVLSGDPAASQPYDQGRPEFYQLDEDEFQLIDRPEAFPGSKILKSLDKESTTSSGDSEGDSHLLALEQFKRWLTAFYPLKPESQNQWETASRSSSDESSDSQSDQGRFSGDVEKQKRSKELRTRQRSFIRRASKQQWKSSARKKHYEDDTDRDDVDELLIPSTYRDPDAP